MWEKADEMIRDDEKEDGLADRQEDKARRGKAGRLAGWLADRRPAQCARVARGRETEYPLP